MSTRRSRQLGNKYIKAEEIQNFIYDSDEESPNKTLIGEREVGKKSNDKGVVKTRVDRDTRYKDNGSCVRNVDFPVINSQERESAKKVGRLNGSIEKWYEGSSCSLEKKLNNSVSKEQQIKKNNSVFNCLELAVNIGSDSEENVNSPEFKNSESFSKDISKQATEESSEDENSLFLSVRKRPSPGDRFGVSVSKKFKVELDKEMSDAPATKPLKIELELEKKRQEEPIKKRNINAITEELDEISKRWHDSYSKLKQSFQWGPRITKNCNEKWDFHYLPQKIFESYQKRLEGNYYQNPRGGETSYQGGNSPTNCKVAGGESVRVDSEKVDEEGSDALDYEQYTKFPGGSSPMEDGLQAYNSEGHCQMTLRSSNQARNRQDGRIENDAGMSEQSKERASKKASFKIGKDQKKLINPNLQLVVELERCPDPPRQYQNKEALDSNKNFEDSKGNSQDCCSSSQMNSNKSHYEENSAQGPTTINGDDDDKMACPICQIKFEKHRIETHATHCATEKFRD